MNIIKNIENTCKTKKTYINKFLPKHFQIEWHKNGGKKYMTIINDTHKILTGTYRNLGIYQQSNNLWIWASSVGNTDTKTINKIKKLKMFNYLFKNKNDNKSQFYYQLLTQDVIYINYNEKLEWINELLLYLTNGVYYFNPINNMNMQFIILKRIHEQYI
jgi:hypothetical protein